MDYKDYYMKRKEREEAEKNLERLRKEEEEIEKELDQVLNPNSDRMKKEMIEPEYPVYPGYRRGTCIWRIPYDHERLTTFESDYPGDKITGDYRIGFYTTVNDTFDGHCNLIL